MTDMIIAADGTRYIKETTVKRRRRALICILCAIPLALFASAAIIGLVKAANAPHTAPSVTSFNDGFADSKQDDCEQGFAPACEWLRTTKR